MSVADLVRTAPARIVALRVVPAATLLVVMVNCPVVCPAGMVIDPDGGTLAIVDAFPGNGNCPPPPGARGSNAAKPTTVAVCTDCSSVTVPWLSWPPVTVEGFKLRDLMIPATTCGLTVRVAEADVPGSLDAR